MISWVFCLDFLNFLTHCVILWASSRLETLENLVFRDSLKLEYKKVSIIYCKNNLGPSKTYRRRTSYRTLFNSLQNFQPSLCIEFRITPVATASQSVLIAICSQILFKLVKVGIRKRFFARWDIKNVEPKARLFYVKPCKKLFSDRNLSIWEQNFENT